MSERPFFSIIIPVFNAEGELKSCLDSIAVQKNTDYEVIVQDGASTDGSIEVLKDESRFSLNWSSERDSGVYDAMNKAIEKARGQYFIFLGADDAFSSPETLTLFKNALLQHNAQIVSGAVRYTDRENRLVPKIHLPGFGKSLLWRNRLHHQGTAYHRGLFEGRNYELQFTVLADYHLNLRLWKEVNPKYQKVDEVVALADARGLSKSFKWKLYREELRMKSAVLSFGEMVIQYPWVILKYLSKSLAQRI